MTAEVVRSSSMDSFCSPISLDFQGPNCFDGKKIGLGPRLGMSKRHPDGKNSPIARRLRALLRAEGFKTQEALGKCIGEDKRRIGNPFNGYPLSSELAQKLKRQVPGLTRDWLYDGDERGLPVDLRDRLRAAESISDEVEP